MRNKDRRKMEVRVERRENARWEKELQALVDAWVVVESRTGLTLRWMNSEESANTVVKRVNAGGPI